MIPIEIKMKLFWQGLLSRLPKLDPQDLEIISIGWMEMKKIVESETDLEPLVFYNKFLDQIKKVFSSSPSLKGALSMLEEPSLRFSEEGLIDFNQHFENEIINQIQTYVPRIVNEVVTFSRELEEEKKKRISKNDKSST